MRRFRVALLQLSSAGLDQAANLAKGEAACRNAAAAGADVALFPEMWSIGYRLPQTDAVSRRKWEMAATATDGEFVRHFRRLAAELQMAIAITYLRRRSPRPGNSVSLIDRHGEILFTYDKVHTCDFDVEAACAPGEAFEVAALDTAVGPVRVGAMICFDREFPESARSLMLDGADVVLTPNACTLDGLRLKQFEARAFENMIGLAMTNYSAPEHNGNSLAFDGVAYAKGQRRDMCVVEAGPEEGIYFADFDLERMRAYRRREPWGARYRKPRAYRPLVRDLWRDRSEVFPAPRPATAADVEALVEFAADLHRYQDASEPDAHAGAWARDLIEGRHPHVSGDDFAIIEDVRGAIIGSAVLISQTWTYEDVPLRVAQPELIAVRAEARGSGLGHRLMDWLHARSAHQNHDLLAIDGIPMFYRRFGYEMALPLRGEISVAVDDLPPPGREIAVRPATENDLPIIAAAYDASRQRYAVAAVRSGAEWRFDLSGRSPDSQARNVMHIVEDARGEPLGYVAIAPRLAGETITVLACEVVRAAAWKQVTAGVLDWLRREGKQRAGSSACRRIGLCLGVDHPAYARVAHLTPRDEGAYAWYVRIPDLPAFMRRIAPALERRVADSGFGHRSASLRLAFSEGGLRLDFDDGRLIEAESWREPRGLRGVDKGVPSDTGRGDANFPGLTFLQLLFGFRSLVDLNAAYPDCFARGDRARDWLDVLFPKRPSNVWPVL